MIIKLNDKALAGGEFLSLWASSPFIRLARETPIKIIYENDTELWIKFLDQDMYTKIDPYEKFTGVLYRGNIGKFVNLKKTNIYGFFQKK